MNRRERKKVPDLASAEQRIARLHFESANMRLWKEKDAVDAASKREADVKTLVAEINARSHQINNLRSARDQFEGRWKRIDRELQAAKTQVQDLSAELDSMRRSVSWRITGPLRRSVAYLRGMRRGRNTAPDDAIGLTPVGNDSNQSQALTPYTPSNDEFTVRWGLWSSDNFLNPHQAPKQTSAQFQATDADFLSDGKEAWRRHGSKVLNEFLPRGDKINFPVERSPTLTIVVVSYNNPELLLLNLLSIQNNAGVKYEVVIVDNDSNDLTHRILSRVTAAKTIKNPSNLGFSAACMQGASAARGELICFLNNDALIEPGCLDYALKDFSEQEGTGAVGGKILQPDGKLQEAGCILWCDGTTNGYGCGDDPEDLKYIFRRPVDYCSAAFLVTPRKLFYDLGGFDERFSPGYYEDTDYCSRLWSNGYQVIYEPRSIVHHFGNASSASKGEALTYVIRNHERFYQKWKDRLTFHYEPRGENTHAAAVAASDEQTRILAIVPEIPHADSDAESSKQLEALLALAVRGRVTCAVTRKIPTQLDYRDIPRDVEFVDATTMAITELREFTEDYDLVWNSGS